MLHILFTMYPHRTSVIIVMCDLTQFSLLLTPFILNVTFFFSIDTAEMSFIRHLARPLEATLRIIFSYNNAYM